jgi:hypothetical protein
MRSENMHILNPGGFKIFIILPFILELLFGQSKMPEKDFYYFFSEQDTMEIRAELALQGMTYKPMFVVMNSDTIEVSQVSINDQPYRNTKPRFICYGVPLQSINTNQGIYITFKSFTRLRKKINE